MTIHFSQFDDTPPALDELELSPAEKARLEGLKALTGCPVARVVDGVCQEPGCQSQGLKLHEVVLSDETCRQLAEAAGNPEMKSQSASAAEADSLSSGIFHTDNRLRCVL